MLFENVVNEMRYSTHHQDKSGNKSYSTSNCIMINLSFSYFIHIVVVTNDCV